MFKTRGGPENKQLNLYHLSHMVSLLGPPLVKFLNQSETDTPRQYFDKEGEYSPIQNYTFCRLQPMFSAFSRKLDWCYRSTTGELRKIGGELRG